MTEPKPICEICGSHKFWSKKSAPMKFEEFSGGLFTFVGEQGRCLYLKTRDGKVLTLAGMEVQFDPKIWINIFESDTLYLTRLPGIAGKYYGFEV